MLIFPTRQVRTDKTNNIAQIKLKSAKGHIAKSNWHFLQCVAWRIFIVASNAHLIFYKVKACRRQSADRLCFAVYYLKNK